MKTNNVSFRIIGIIILVLLIALGIFAFAVKAYEEHRDEVAFLTEEEANKRVKSGIAQQAYDNSFDVYLNNEKLFFDKNNSLLYYSIPENFSETDAIKITTSKEDSEYCGVILCDNGETNLTDIELSEAATYQFIIYNRNEAYLASITFTSLPIMSISLEEELPELTGTDKDWNLITAENTTYWIEEEVPMHIEVYDNSADAKEDERFISEDGKIRQRGGTTIYWPQRSYRLSLLEDNSDIENSDNVKANLLGMRNDDDWILYAPFSDQEKVRNVFSMNLWKNMSEGNNEWGASNSLEYKYVELFINNEYWGLYALSYPLDEKQEAIDKESNDEYMLKKKDWSNSEYVHELVAFDDTFNWLPGYSVKAGDSTEAYKVVHELYKTLAYSDSIDEVRNVADIDNGIDFWLYLQFVYGIDNVYQTNVKNIYTIAKKTDDGYKLLFAPWDMDETFGNCYSSESGSYGIGEYQIPSDAVLDMQWGQVAKLIELNDTEIIAQIKVRYTELREGALSDESINAMLNEYEDDIYNSGAFKRTKSKFQDGKYNDASDGLTTFKSYVNERLNFMDNYIESLS